jgi:formamidopyrimidine-DNA glycosylase
MPELPEVETVARQLDRTLPGRTLRGLAVADPKLARLEPLAPRLAGAVLGPVRRSGKRVVLSLREPDGSPRGWLAVHLRMTGRLLEADAEAPDPTHLRLRLWLEPGRLDFTDARRFGTVDWVTDPAGLRPPGLDPFEAACSVAALTDLSRGSRTPLKAWLLDQTRITGLGNIYACEILHACGVSPHRAAGSLLPEDWTLLRREMRRILRLAIRHCGTTFRDFQDSRGVEGSFAGFLQVYGRAGEPCVRCGGVVVRETQSQRGSWWCPACQR